MSHSIDVLQKVHKNEDLLPLAFFLKEPSTCIHNATEADKKQYKQNRR